MARAGRATRRPEGGAAAERGLDAPQGRRVCEASASPLVLGSARPAAQAGAEPWAHSTTARRERLRRARGRFPNSAPQQPAPVDPSAAPAPQASVADRARCGLHPTLTGPQLQLLRSATDCPGEPGGHTEMPHRGRACRAALHQSWLSLPPHAPGRTVTARRARGSCARLPLRRGARRRRRPSADPRRATGRPCRLAHRE